MTRSNERLLDFFHRIRFETLPDAVVHQVSRAFLDAYACTLAGLATPVGQKVVALSRHFIQSEGATVPSVSQRVMPVMAAMTNGFLANALDADDGHRMSRLHCGGVIFPTVVAALQVRACNGETFITAIVLGYEIALRAGIVLNMGNRYFGSANGGAYGAAAAAGHVMGLCPDKIVDAVGITEIQAPICQPMSWVKARRIPMIKEGMGWAAATGLTAVMMAEQGITGTLTLFDDPRASTELDSLGKEYEILKLYFKPYPSCRWTHAPLENFLKIVAAQQIKPEEIVRIRISTSEKGSHLNLKLPSTLEDAQYSTPFVVGAAAVDGEFGPKQMTLAKLGDPQIQDLAARIEISSDADIEAQYPAFIKAVVEVETTDGQIFRQANELITGDWNQPLSDERLADKFYTYATPVLGEKKAQAFHRQVMKLETVENMDCFLSSIWHGQ